MGRTSYTHREACCKALAYSMSPTVEQIFAYVGAAYTIVSTLGHVLPQSWAFTKVLNAIALDLRGLVPGARS